VRRRPYSVVLLDEIEKAHHDVFNVLLQVLDDGRLTDGHGRTVDFTNTVLIMTSNLGSEFIEPDLSDEVVHERVMSAVRSSFRPEFLNRVDDIVVFHRLTKEDLRHIVEIQVEHLSRRLRDRRIDLVLTDGALDWLAEHGYDPVYGARPLKRLIQRELGDRLAFAMLDGEVSDDSAVKVEAGVDGLTLT
jgi:ATP-dependent Clp protease ATP-binding subunit ClpB